MKIVWYLLTLVIGLFGVLAIVRVAERLLIRRGVFANTAINRISVAVLSWTLLAKRTRKLIVSLNKPARDGKTKAGTERIHETYPFGLTVQGLVKRL